MEVDYHSFPSRDWDCDQYERLISGRQIRTWKWPAEQSSLLKNNSSLFGLEIVHKHELQHYALKLFISVLPFIADSMRETLLAAQTLTETQRALRS